MSSTGILTVEDSKMHGRDAHGTHGQDARATGHTPSRWLVRGICLVLAVVALSPLASGTFLSALVPALSPFVAVAAMLATRTFHAMAWLGLLVAVAVLLRHRLFCRWACPAGLCLEGGSRLGRRWGRRTVRFPLLGRWIVGLALGGACLGFPFLLWLDPLARFTGLFALGKGDLGLGYGLSAAGFLALLLLDLLYPNIWCACLCPLGAFQDLLSSLSRFLRSGLRGLTGTSGTVPNDVMRRLRSMGVPPMSSTAVPAVSAADVPSVSLRTDLPVENPEIHGRDAHATHGQACPFGKLRAGSERSRRDARATNFLPRRMVLALTAGAAWGGVVRWHRPGTARVLRPPGAVDEPRFPDVCTRCGNCVRVCPSGIVKQDLGQNGWASLLTPVLRFQKDYCREDCVRCTEACPSGALRRLPLAQKTSMRLGLPRVDMNVCLLADDRECSACRSRCPYDAVRYLWSEADYTLTPQIDPEKCTGCGACEAACPTTPHKAIVVLPTWRPVL